MNDNNFKQTRYLGDIAAQHGVEINVRHDGLTIWVNCDGICVARIATNGFVPITMTDDRKSK